MKNIIVSLITLMFAIPAYAQQLDKELNATGLILCATGISPTQVSDTVLKAKSPPLNAGYGQPDKALSVQLLFGSQGIGADIKYGFVPKFSGRVGFGLIPVNWHGVSDFSGFSTANQLSARFTNVHLLADYQPFRSPFFRLVAGASYIIKGTANVVIAPQGNYQFGSSTVTAGQVGEVDAGVYWKGVAPYLGVSLFNSFPSRFFNANVDLGTYYLPRPSTSFTGTNLLADNSSQAPQFNKNMQGYRWLPVIQLNFNFRAH